MYLVYHPKEPGSPEELPEWVTQYITEKRMQSSDTRVRMRAMRNAACGYISRKQVRDCIFSRKGDKCYMCGKPATQIDHRIPVWQFARDPKNYDYREMNYYSNLFPICQKCNCTY